MNIPISNSPTLLHKTQHRRVTLALLIQGCAGYLVHPSSFLGF